MSPTIVVVIIAAGTGTLLSALALGAAILDGRFVRKHRPDDEELVDLANQNIIEEAGRLFIQLAFLAAAIASAIGNARLQMVTVWFLVGVPVSLAAWTTYALLKRRRALLRD